MACKRLTELRFGKEVVAEVSRLVELHLRFHGYGEGEWTDSAVRRYVRRRAAAGAIARADQGRLHHEERAQGRAARGPYDALEARIEELREREELRQDQA